MDKSKKNQKKQKAADDSLTPKKSKKKLLTLESTQMWSPIKDILDGIVLTKDGNYVQILEFSPINYNLFPEEDQVAIADTFGAIVRTFPDEFHIKILSRKANVDTHVRNLKACMDIENNPQCRQMQANSIQQIQTDAISGVSRRFFVAFPYKQPTGLRRPSWDEIKSSLYLQAQHMASQMASEPCNNDLLSPIGSTEHVLNILYDCMCRTEAEFKSLDAKIADVVARYIVEQGYTDDGKTKIPINDFLAPKRIDRNAFTYTVVDGKFYIFGYVHRNSYETIQRAGWLTLLANLGEGVDVDIFVEQKDPKEEKTKLSYAMQVSHTEVFHKSSTSADLDNLRNKIYSEEYLRNGLSANQKLLYFSIMVTVVADSLSELKAKWKLVHKRLFSSSLLLRPLHSNHDLAFLSSLPLCQPNRSVTRFAKRNILSADFGGMYPFTSYEINDPNGIMIGRNKANNSPLFLDFFNRYLYNNGNVVIFGSTGSGKTYLLLCLAMRLRQYQTQTIIIAPYKGHEYIPSCSAIGGTYISLAPGSEHNINIMEIRRYDNSTNAALDGAGAAGGSILTAKIQQLLTFFKLLKRNLTHEESHILEEALLATYKDFGITRGNKSLEDPKRPGKYKTMPTLGDLDLRLKEYKKGADGLRTVLASFITGICKNFNGQTNVNLDNPYVVIDVSNMPNDLMPVAIFMATDFVYDTIRADRLRRKAIIMDELSRMIGIAGSPEAAEFVHTLYKTVRAYNTIAISATQEINDFFALNDGHYGRGIMANAKIKIILKQENEEATTLGKTLRLSDIETQNLAYYQRGEGLLIANRNHAEVRVVASSIEHMLITTDAEQLSKLIEYR